MLAENPADMTTDELVNLLNVINNEFAAILVSKEQLEEEIKKRAVSEQRSIRTNLVNFVYVSAGTQKKTDTTAYNAAIKAAGIDKNKFQYEEERDAHVQMRKVVQK